MKIPNSQMYIHLSREEQKRFVLMYKGKWFTDKEYYGGLSWHPDGEMQTVVNSGGISIDDFIRQYGEPHEIEAWFGEEKLVITPISGSVVLARSKSDYDELMSIYEKAGWKWCTGKRPTKQEQGTTIHDYVRIGDNFSRMTKSDVGGMTILTIQEFKEKQGLSTAKQQGEQSETYPDWKSLTPLPDKARPWAKKGERYVRVKDSSALEGGRIYLYEKELPNAPYAAKLQGEWMGSHWEFLAKIPGETYAEEPGEEPVPPITVESITESIADFRSATTGDPTLESLNGNVPVGQRFVFTKNSPEIKGRFKIVKKAEKDNYDCLGEIYAFLRYEGTVHFGRPCINDWNGVDGIPYCGTTFERLPDHEVAQDEEVQNNTLHQKIKGKVIGQAGSSDVASRGAPTPEKPRQTAAAMRRSKRLGRN